MTGHYYFLGTQSTALLAGMSGNSDLRGPKGKYAEVTRDLEERSYKTEDRGFIERIDSSVAQNLSPSIDLLGLSAKLLARTSAITREFRTRDTIFNPWKKANAKTNFQGFYTEQAAVPYETANIATVDVPGDIQAAIRGVRVRGEIPNSIVMSRDTWNFVRKSPLLGQFIYGSIYQGKAISVAEFEAAFAADAGVSIKLIIPDSVFQKDDERGFTKNGVRPPQESYGYIWKGLDYIWVGNINDGADRASTVLGPDGSPAPIYSTGVGRTILFTENGQSPSGFVTESWFENLDRCHYTRVRTHCAEHITNPNAGQLVDLQKVYTGP